MGQEGQLNAAQAEANAEIRTTLSKPEAQTIPEVLLWLFCLWPSPHHPGLLAQQDGAPAACLSLKFLSVVSMERGGCNYQKAVFSEKKQPNLLF